MSSKNRLSGLGVASTSRSNAGRSEKSAGWAGYVFLILVVVASTACGFIPLTGISTPSTSTAAPSAATANPRNGTTPGAAPSPIPPAKADLSDVHAIARQVYSQVQAGQDLTPLLAGIFAGFGIPVLNEASDRDKGLAMIKAGKPAVFDVQLANMGQGFANGVLINVDSLMKDLSAHGVQALSPAGPVTAAYLKSGLAYLTSKTSYTPDETLPALIIALGQERARLSGQKNPDPVWGDGFLDPLQYMLLAYGVGFTAIKSVAQTSAGSLGMAFGGVALPPAFLVLPNDRPLQESPGILEKLLKALDPTNIPGFVICGLYLMENSQFYLEIDPAAVYHRQMDVSGPPPYQATITGSLFMTSDPSPSVRDLLSLAGCSMPPNKGPLPGKTIAWTLDDVAQQHGSLTSSDTKTKDDGTVRAVYETVIEQTPQAGRIPAALQQVQGEIQATVLDLVAGHENLEAITHLAGGADKTFWVYPDIRFYGPLVLDISGSYQIPGRDVTVNNVFANQSVPLTGDPDGTLRGSVSLPVSSSATFICGSAGTVQAKGSFTAKFQVILTAVGGSNSDQLKLSFLPDLSLLKAPVANTQCVAGDLNDVAWAATAVLMTAKPTFGPSDLTYSFTPPKAKGAIVFTLKPAGK